MIDFIKKTDRIIFYFRFISRTQSRTKKFTKSHLRPPPTSTPPLFAWKLPMEMISNVPHDGSNGRTESVYSGNFATLYRCICKYPNLPGLHDWHENTRSHGIHNTQGRYRVFRGMIFRSYAP